MTSNFEIVAIVVSLLTAMASLITAYNAHRKLQSEVRSMAAESQQFRATAAEAITQATVALLSPLRRRLDEQGASIEDLKKRLAEKDRQIVRLTKEVDELKRGVSILERQIIELGEIPRYEYRKGKQDDSG